jgi:hypothetical protein
MVPQVLCIGGGGGGAGLGAVARFFAADFFAAFAFFAFFAIDVSLTALVRRDYKLRVQLQLLDSAAGMVRHLVRNRDGRGRG